MLRVLRGGSAVFLIVAGGAAAASFVLDVGLPRDLLLAVASALAAIFFALHLLVFLGDRRQEKRCRSTMEAVELDPAPTLVTDEAGIVLAANPAARDRLGATQGMAMARALDAAVATPDAVAHRLRTTAGAGASAREDVAALEGLVRVSTHPAPGGLVWRVEALPTRPARVTGSIELPVATMGPGGTIVFMNDALREAVGQRMRRVADLFEKLPLRSGALNRMTVATGTVGVRTILSAQGEDGRQDVIVLPAGDAGEGRSGHDDLPVALLRLGAQGRVLSANRLARELLPAIGAGEEDRFAAMVEGLGRSVREWIGEATSGRGLYKPEVVRVTGAEVETYLQVTFGPPVDDQDGGLVAVLSDATELKTLEAQFVQSQKMQAIGQLAGGVAHDFNNLLTAISGHCDLLLLRHDEADEDYADLAQIMHNANRAAALVGQLLAFSRKQTLEMELIDVRETLGDLTHLLDRLVSGRVSLRLEHDPALVPIRGDRRQLEQVIMNLVVNARDAMPDGGEVRISTRCRYLDAPMVRDRVTVPPGQYVVIEVADEGTGITPDNLTRIFEPFFTTKRPGEGTGLGLSMAYGIVKQSGGYIFADSAAGGGTVFSLYFPATLDARGVDAVAPAEGVRAMAPPLPDRSAGPRGAAPDAVPPAPGAPSQAAGEDDMPDAMGLPEPPRPEAVPDADPVAEPRREAAPAPTMPAPDDEAIAQLRDLVAGTRREPDAPSAADRTVPAPAAASAPPLPPDPSPAGPAGPAAKAVVLLVEDEAPVRAFASRALRLRGYEVLEAESAEAALQRLSDADLLVDVFVTDVMMPGLDGPTWVRQALKARPDVRTIFISGYAQDALSETSAPVPNAIFLPKPFSLSDLTRTVEKALQ